MKFNVCDFPEKHIRKMTSAHVLRVASFAIICLIFFNILDLAVGIIKLNRMGEPLRYYFFNTLLATGVAAIAVFSGWKSLSKNLSNDEVEVKDDSISLYLGEKKKVIVLKDVTKIVIYPRMRFWGFKDPTGKNCVTVVIRIRFSLRNRVGSYIIKVILDEDLNSFLMEFNKDIKLPIRVATKATMWSRPY